jgi:N-acetylglutamate synthase
MESVDARLLDDLAGRATAPTTVEPLDGWQLRADEEAPFRRANSVLATGDVADLDDALRIVEDFYGSRGQPARFRISRASRPPELDAVLAARGYEIEAPVVVACSDAATVLARTDGNGHITKERDGAWGAAYGSLHDDDPGSRDRVLAYRRSLDRLDCPTVAAVAPVDAARLLALGFGVAERGWTGIFGMGTRPEGRRQGAATAVLHTIAEWAVAQDAARLYLQVELDNAPARSLYARAGFVDAYRYHYRTRPT